jgi:hypothetical protein
MVTCKAVDFGQSYHHKLISAMEGCFKCQVLRSKQNYQNKVPTAAFESCFVAAQLKNVNLCIKQIL